MSLLPLNNERSTPANETEISEHNTARAKGATTSDNTTAQPQTGSHRS